MCRPLQLAGRAEARVGGVGSLFRERGARVVGKRLVSIGIAAATPAGLALLSGHAVF